MSKFSTSVPGNTCPETLHLFPESTCQCLSCCSYTSLPKSPKRSIHRFLQLDIFETPWNTHNLFLASDMVAWTERKIPGWGEFHQPPRNALRTRDATHSPHFHLLFILYLVLHSKQFRSCWLHGQSRVTLWSRDTIKYFHQNTSSNSCWLHSHRLPNIQENSSKEISML